MSNTIKYYRETHNEVADLAVIQYGGGTVCMVEPIEITEGEIQKFITECEGAYGRPASLAVEIGISWIMDKLNKQS